MQLNATIIDTSEIQTRNWSQIFNTSLLSTLIESKDGNGLRDLETLVQTPEFESLILAAQNLSNRLGLEPELATERLIHTFREIDSCWKEVLLKKGAESLIRLKI